MSKHLGDLLQTPRNVVDGWAAEQRLTERLP